MSEEKKQKKEVKKKIKKLSPKERIAELEHKYKLVLAEQQNLIKQKEREKEEFVKYANERLLSDMIPVYDNLKTSMKFADDEVKNNGWAQGIEYIIKQFKDVLVGLGVEEIKTVGEKFDINTMDAMEGEGEVVKKEVKAGYKLNGKVIVPAKVILE